MQLLQNIKQGIIAVIIAFPLIGNAQQDSLSMQQAIETALVNNYDIIIQKNNVSIDSMNNAWGETGILPTVNFTGVASNTWNSGDADYTNQNLSGKVNLNWNVFRGFKAVIQKQKLEEYQKMSETNLGLVVENTIVDVTLCYYDVLLSEEKMKLAEKIMKLSEDRYLREKRKKDMGASFTYDMLQAQNAWLEDKSSFLSAQSNYRNAIRQLNYLMANEENIDYALSSDFNPDTVAFEYTILEDKLLSNNKTLKNQYTNLTLAKLNVRTAKSSYYPTFALGASSGLSNTNTEYSDTPTMDQNNNQFSNSVSATLSYEIYNGGNRLRALKEARIDEFISKVELSQMQRELKNQLAQVHEQYELRKNLLEVAKENEKAALLNLEISKKKLDAGAINSFEYRQVQEMYANASLSVLTSIYKTVESFNALMRLTGGIIEE